MWQRNILSPPYRTITGLSPGTIYRVQVQGFSAEQTSDWSEELIESTVPATLASWRENYFGQESGEGDAADNASPMKDGLSNLIKYAFGMNPFVDSVEYPGLPQEKQISVSGETEPFLALEFTLPSPLPEGVTVEVWTSTDLSGWTQDAVLEVEDDSVPGETHYVWRAPQATSQTGEVFLQVRVLRE